MRPRKAVLVVWRDALQPGEHWRKTGDLPKPDPGTVVSVGFIVRKSKKAIALAQSLDEGAEHCLSVLVVPRSAILGITTIWKAQ